MKTILNRLCALCACALLLLGLAGCKTDPDGLWQDATYTCDTVIGAGQTRLQVEIAAGEKTITLTVNTDQTTLGQALAELDVIQGEEGPYGLYVKTVNGIFADYDVNGAYWSFTQNGELLLTGVDEVQIADGQHYEITYTR